MAMRRSLGRSSLLRRIEDLEGQVTDESGLDQMAKVMSGEEAGKPGMIPLEVWDALAE
jgi:hypothetical protein